MATTTRSPRAAVKERCVRDPWGCFGALGGTGARPPRRTSNRACGQRLRPAARRENRCRARAHVPGGNTRAVTAVLRGDASKRRRWGLREGGQARGG